MWSHLFLLPPSLSMSPSALPSAFLYYSSVSTLPWLPPIPSQYHQIKSLVCDCAFHFIENETQSACPGFQGPAQLFLSTSPIPFHETPLAHSALGPLAFLGIGFCTGSSLCLFISLAELGPYSSGLFEYFLLQEAFLDYPA